MNIKNFIHQLEQAQDLMKAKNYKGALNILEKLKVIEENGDFDHNLTHKLYQLISNSRSLLNQQMIFKIIKEIKKKKPLISFEEINKLLKKKENLDLEIDVLKREIEILILRNILSCKIDRNNLIF
ncbi:MAG: hypothetical protein ACFFAN_10180 [Promethearchaeota archaeon]